MPARRSSLGLGGVIKALWWAALGGSLLLWLYFWWDPEALPSLSFLLYAPYPAYLAPVVLLALLMWPLGGRWRWLAWMPTLVITWPVMGFSLGMAQEGRNPVRVMSYNVKTALLPGVPKGYQKLTLEIAQAAPDILMLQDAPQWLGIQHSHPDLYKMMMGNREVQAYGQYIIASRFPLKHCARGSMPNQGPHSFFHCEADIRGQRVKLVNVHFNTPRDGLNAARVKGIDGLKAWKENMSQRLAQSAHVADFVRQTRGPCIVAGDLNAPEHSRVVQGLLDQGLKDAYSTSSWGWGYTYGHSLIKGLAFLRIDHILVSKDIAVQQVVVGGMEASQHRPVTADLYLQRD
jgi:endonuclease/exonuclease/phosphatase (EEP) superfamily protein YafD